MKEKVKITGVPETMIQTLYARAKETQKNNAKIKDDIAVEIVEKLDYDFSKADNDKTMASGVIARTIVLDEMVGEYLDTHSDTVVVNIGCGMDTRCYRMQGKYKCWYNIDLPETIEIRKIETMSPFFVKHMKEKSIEGSNAKFSWGVKNGKDLQQIVPAFNWKRDVSLVEGMKVIMPVYNVLGIIPAVCGMSNKIVVMER